MQLRRDCLVAVALRDEREDPLLPRAQPLQLFFHLVLLSLRYGGVRG
jgi:hypothetical protein